MTEKDTSENTAGNQDKIQLLSNYLGCSLQDPSALLPIPDDIVAGMRQEAEKVTSGNLSISLRIFRIAVVSHAAHVHAYTQKSPASFHWSDSSKNGGYLLSHLVGQYHRR